MRKSVALVFAICLIAGSFCSCERKYNDMSVPSKQEETTAAFAEVPEEEVIQSVTEEQEETSNTIDNIEKERFLMVDGLKKSIQRILEIINKIHFNKKEDTSKNNSPYTATM